MSQLSFAEFFDQARESGSVIPMVATAKKQPIAGLMSVDAARKQFIRLFNDTARYMRRWDVFCDFITLSASELDLARVLTPENIERSRKICERYEAADIQKMHELFILMVCALDAKFHDFLGAIFMELELGSNGMGQYFTPYSVQSMMARMMMPGVKDTIRREGFVTVSDPASGAAGMIVAYAECLLEAGYDHSNHMFGSCIDIDPIAADMAFVQLSLLGIPAEVITGNTLTMQLHRARYTPVYYLNDFKNKLEFQRRIKAMKDFMYGLDIAA
ncbi:MULTISPECIES: N-6 DNA methylase [Citrobacter freundii complex]|uniref:N-6 DNA methylase n=1 Tax=Citrobacter freundii complex TaxID=1344959 RepID=UPI000EF1E44D|nr:N-6 DNA methylase [Citrobacter freundii]AYL49929.1 N-6 DNA methylase [Citrobacter freundii]HEJ0145043.1 SAM-dependent DNA methyltransferase [Citrobacter freundii]